MRSIGSATENERPYLPANTPEKSHFFHEFSILSREQKKKRTNEAVTNAKMFDINTVTILCFASPSCDVPVVLFFYVWILKCRSKGNALESNHRAEFVVNGMHQLPLCFSIWVLCASGAIEIVTNSLGLTKHGLLVRHKHTATTFSVCLFPFFHFQ